MQGITQYATSTRDMMLLDQKEHISQEEHRQLIEALENKYNSKKNKGLFAEYIRDRNYMIMLTLWNTGARIGDICTFKDTNIDPIKRSATFPVNKLSKKDNEGNILKASYHTVLLEDTYIIEYQNYIKKWGISGYLFCSFGKTTPINVRTVQQFLKEYGIIAGLGPKIHPHLYRHGIAIHMRDAGVPIEMISKFLGDQSVETTYKFYAKITPQVAWTFIQGKTTIN
jgi:integrase/recombinase XerD